MNIASQVSDPGSGYFVNFNQDFTSLAVGSKNGYKLFTLSAVDNLVQIYENASEDICLVERLFNSSLVAVVCLSSPRKLKVCHFKKGTEICNYSYSNTILAVKLNRSRLVVCLEEALYIHNITDMRVLHTIRDTPPNPAGLCALSYSGDISYLAYPGSSTIGEVQVFDALDLQAKTMIPAHDSPLAALAFSYSGQQLATASERGTVIRVYSVVDGTRLFEFRRGVKRCVNIASLSFSMDATFLCCSSNTETVHVFRLDQPDPARPSQPTQQPAEAGPGWIDLLSKAVSRSANLLPTKMTEVFSQGRAFATAHLPFQGVRSVCCVVSIQKVPRLLVASADGYLYVYDINTLEGGDCTLLRQHRLDGKVSEGTPPTSTTSPVDTSTDKGTSVVAPSSGSPASKTDYSNRHKDGYNYPAAPTPTVLPQRNTGGKPPHTIPFVPKLFSANILSSYAGILKGSSSADVMSESDKRRELACATEQPPEGGFRFDDDAEFPPVTQKTE